MRMDNAEGVAIPNEIGYGIQYFQKYIRKYLNPKKDIVSMWVNKVGGPLGMCCV
jgi:hypothetical protein